MGAELLRRVEETLANYVNISLDESDSMDDRDGGITINTRYTTPYGYFTNVHTGLINELVMDAVKCPATIEKKFIYDNNDLLAQENVYTNWYVNDSHSQLTKTGNGN